MTKAASSTPRFPMARRGPTTFQAPPSQVAITCRFVDVGVEPDMGELVEDDELQVAAHADVRCVLEAAEAAKVTRTRRLVVAEDDLEVRQAQLSRPEAGHSVIEPCPLLAVGPLHDDRGLTPQRRCWFCPITLDTTRTATERLDETRRIHPRSTSAGAVGCQSVRRSLAAG